MSDDDRDDGDGRAPDEGEESSMDAFLETLAVSLRPDDIEDARHEAILAQALGDEVAAHEREPTAAETRASETLRDLLALGVGPIPVQGSGAASEAEVRLVMLARALRLAYSPGAIDQLTNERLLKPALALPSRAAVRRYVAATTFVLVAAAAAVFGLFLRTEKPAGSARADLRALPMIEAHTTTTLFNPTEPFPRSGGTTSRVDRIEASRNAELRENLFASWGVE
jgi:hypothetical protein